MPYVLEEFGRYVGEHSCGIYHYGNMALVRPCCVEDCTRYANLALNNAMTDQHPAYRLYVTAFNALTDAERALVPDVFYAGANFGVISRPKSS